MECAIFAAEIIIMELAALLRSAFRDDPDNVKNVVNPLFSNYAPLATFSGRIQVAFVLCLITKSILSDINLLRQIRNDFALEPGPLTFSDPHGEARIQRFINSPRGQKVPQVLLDIYARTKEVHADDQAKALRKMFVAKLMYLTR